MHSIAAIVFRNETYFIDISHVADLFLKWFIFKTVAPVVPTEKKSSVTNWNYSKQIVNKNVWKPAMASEKCKFWFNCGYPIWITNIQ